MMLIGMLAMGVLLGAYAAVSLGSAVLALVATFRCRSSVALTFWGLTLWLDCAPVLAFLLSLNGPFSFAFEGHTLYSGQSSPLVEGFWTALLLSYALLSPLLLLPLVFALVRARRTAPRVAVAG